MDTGIAFAVVSSPFGPIHLAATANGVIGLEMRTVETAFRAAVAARIGGSEANLAAPTGAASRVLADAVGQLEAYAGGRRRQFSVPIDVRVRSAWDRRVLDGVRSIGFGQVTSYGRLAGLVGSPGAARAAGSAVGRNPIGLLVPCHRVIAGDGTIGGYGGGWYGDREELLALKRALLEHEGVRLPAIGLIG
jgi:methylated-DNA-[protein]-cysteine S-methyltransferase